MENTDSVNSLPAWKALVLGVFASCASVPPEQPVVGAGTAQKLDPSQSEVPVEAAAGWSGTLVVDQGPIGIWTVMALKVFPQFGCPEVVGLDDKGRLHAFWSYSGKWTPATAVNDGKWLGGLAQADVDPRIPGRELYTGSQNGNLWQVRAHLETFLDSRLVAQLPGHEVHTLVAADFDPQRPGDELLVFTRPGALFLATPRTDGLDGFETRRLGDLEGRIRDAVLLPSAPGKPTRVLTAGRHGKLEILSFAAGEPRWETVLETPMGLGRVALAPGATSSRTIAYAVADDGCVWRLELGEGEPKSERIYLGPQGMRGCAAGRFDADPSVETVAVFGYSGVVELLSRREGRWTAETIFTDRDKGHWLCAGEFDGRNSTDELVSSGYSGRVVLLSRPPGYGRPGMPVTPTGR